jgi:hypothetical protein
MRRRLGWPVRRLCVANAHVLFSPEMAPLGGLAALRTESVSRPCSELCPVAHKYCRPDLGLGIGQNLRERGTV